MVAFIFITERLLDIETHAGRTSIINVAFSVFSFTRTIIMGELFFLRTKYWQYYR